MENHGKRNDKLQGDNKELSLKLANLLEQYEIREAVRKHTTPRFGFLYVLWYNFKFNILQESEDYQVASNQRVDLSQLVLNTCIANNAKILSGYGRITPRFINCFRSFCLKHLFNGDKFIILNLFVQHITKLMKQKDLETQLQEAKLQQCKVLIEKETEKNGKEKQMVCQTYPRVGSYIPK